MAGFSALGLGLLLGAVGGGTAATVAARRRNQQQAPTPGAQDATAAATPPPAPPDANRAASDAVSAGRDAAVRVRRRAGSAAQGPRARTPGRSIGIARPQVEPRTLLGY